jgi:hypothetical protein
VIRKNSYDWLGQTVSAFQQHLEQQNDMLAKSNKFETLGSIDAAIEGHHEESDICKHLYQQFTDLRDDYTKGRIVLVKYREHLQKFRNLLENSGEKIKNPNLHAEEIAGEIKKHFLC